MHLTQLTQSIRDELGIKKQGETRTAALLTQLQKKIEVLSSDVPLMASVEK